MAELVENVPARPRVSWGAVFAGAVAAVGLWMLLYAFGLAIGASTLNVQNAGSAKATGIFTGVWGVVAPLIALFVGGFVAGHGAGVWGRGDSALHGLVTWGLATIGGAWLLAGLVSSIAGGVASLGRGAAHAAGAAGGETGQVEQAMRSAGLNAEDAVRPLNQRLRAEGHPTVSPDQLEAAARDALQRSVREGRFDRGVLITSLSQNTSLSRSDAEDLAAQVSTQVEGARSQLASDLQSATNAASKALWGAFIALALGLIASIVGGLVGAPGTKKRHRREPAPAPIPTARPVGPPREVYP